MYLRNDGDLFASFVLCLLVFLVAVDSGSVKDSREETGGATDLAEELQKQCAIVSAVQTPPLLSGMTAGHLSTAPSVGISTSEQLRQLVALLSKKNEQWSVPLPSDRQLVVTDELQSSISKVCALVSFLLFYLYLLTVSMISVLMAEVNPVD